MTESPAGETRTAEGVRRWLVLIHQLPPEPAALRVRVWRRLQTLGALQLKSSVYLLPDGEPALEDFEWLVEEIRRGGGDATLWRSEAIEGIDESEIVAQFQALASVEYEELERDVRAVHASVEHGPERARLVARLVARFREIGARDHFGAPRREVVGALLEALEHADVSAIVTTPTKTVTGQGLTWVTRADVGIDRMASAWLIRRRIDLRARFAFTRDKHYAPAAGEVRFDMYSGEYTHEGDLCTFEVLLRRHALSDAALVTLGEIVHDIDLKDGRYGHVETAGISAAFAGIAASIADDIARIDVASTLLDGLLEALRVAAPSRTREMPS
jgi:hypothetical protein